MYRNLDITFGKRLPITQQTATEKQQTLNRWVAVNRLYRSLARNFYLFLATPLVVSQVDNIANPKCVYKLLYLLLLGAFTVDTIISKVNAVASHI